MQQPLNFTIAIRDFDLHLLPEDSREPGSDRFQRAVADYFGQQFEPMQGNTLVSMDAEKIEVSWVPDPVSSDPMAHALSLLRSGQVSEAVSLLNVLLAARPDDVQVLYNLGMAESDQGDLGAAVHHLARAVENDPNDINALVALAVAQQRDGQTEDAVRNLERALAHDPDNGYAHRNLGSIYGSQGRNQEATGHLREAARLLPDDQNALFGLAQALMQSGGEGSIAEADQLYRRVISLDADSAVGGLARDARRGIAEQTFRGVAGLRMDAVMYCLAALEKFAGMDRQQVQAVAFEIALLGQGGLKVNDATSRYTLRSLPGTFSGLNLVCFMYVGFQQIAPGNDVGFDLSREYAAAKQLFGKEQATV